MKQFILLIMTLFLTAFGYGQTIIFEEDFNGSTIPDDWVTGTDADGGQTWTFGSGEMPGSSGVGSADFPTNAAIFDDDASGDDGNHDKSYLLFPNTIGAVDLTDYLDMQITLEYEYALNTLDPADDTLELFISNGEGGFILVKSYGVDTDITLDSVDVTQLLADNPGMDVTNFFFKFVYDDIDSDYSWGAGVDNVRLIAVEAPDNDLCENATPLTVGTEFGQYDVEGTLLGSSAELHTWVDVWYSVEVPSTGGFIVETAQAPESVMNDTWMEVHSGSCGSLSLITFSDDDGEGLFSKITVTGETPGDVLYVHVGKDGAYSGQLDSFLVSAYAIPPANDECVDAIELDVEYNIASYEDATPTAGTIYGSTDSGIEAETCDGWTGTADDDVWYSFVANSEVISITLEDTFDGIVNLFEGSCGGLTLIGCKDSGANPQIDMTDLTVGEEYFIRVFSYSSSPQINNDFNIAVWSEGFGVGIADTLIDGFNMYPNPVKDVLNLTAQNKIDFVSIYNLVGQEVLTVLPNTTETQVDMSNLPVGAYIVKVQAGSQLGSYNLIKE